MNTKHILTLVALGTLLTAGSAMAGIGADVGSYARAQADASASYEVNYQPVLDAADEARAEAEAKVQETVDGVMEAKAEAEADGHARAEAGQQTSAEARTSVFDGLKTNLDAFVKWSRGIWVQPEADLEPSQYAHALADAKVTHEPGKVRLDGITHADLLTEDSPRANLDYEVPPTPEPQMGFFASIQASLTSFLGIGE